MASIIYFCEHNDNDKIRSMYTSLYFTTITLTHVAARRPPPAWPPLNPPHPSPAALSAVRPHAPGFSAPLRWAWLVTPASAASPPTDGDISPVTDAGRLVASICSAVGIGLFTLPTTILAQGFLDLKTETAEERMCVVAGHPGSVCGANRPYPTPPGSHRKEGDSFPRPPCAATRSTPSRRSTTAAAFALPFWTGQSSQMRRKRRNVAEPVRERVGPLHPNPFPLTPVRRSGEEGGGSWTKAGKQPSCNATADTKWVLLSSLVSWAAAQPDGLAPRQVATLRSLVRAKSAQLDVVADTAVQSVRDLSAHLADAADAARA